MHSFHGQTANFHFHGDFGGEVIICGKDAEGKDVEIRVEAEDILKLVAYHYVQSQLVGKIEDMDFKELLLRLKL